MTPSIDMPLTASEWLLRGLWPSRDNFIRDHVLAVEVKSNVKSKRVSLGPLRTTRMQQFAANAAEVKVDYPQEATRLLQQAIGKSCTPEQASGLYEEVRKDYSDAIKLATGCSAFFRSISY